MKGLDGGRIAEAGQAMILRTELLTRLRAEIATAAASDLPSISGALEELRLQVQLRLFGPEMRSLPQDNNDRLLSVDQVAQRLHQKPRWVRAHKRDLPVVDLPGRSLRFSEKRLNSYIQRRLAG